MWFKNLAIYRLTEAFTLTPTELEEKLHSLRFKPCSPTEVFSYGWTSPLGRNSEQLIHQANGFMMLCATKEEKVLPTSVINEMTADKISEKEDQEARKLTKKERSELKDQIIFELLPRAFSFSKRTFAYIDPKGGWLIVDAASAKKAEELISFLRKNLVSLPLVPVSTKEKPVTTMTQWLVQNSAPTDVLVEDECELRAPEESGGIIRCKRQDLAAPEIKNHLDTGKQVIKLAISWSDRLSFIVDENLSIKRLKFLDLIQDQVADTETGSAEEQFDVDFTIMSQELSSFLPRMLELFGGENINA
ncbi:MAG TPA: recombination-associated protein RdgC [Methyloprofundus sp.]|uniref:recombination-associated protein RdgC n=1 Tax=Methyloprofundus sp. TaxID=2020875 RepID=UPI001822EB10|nr:recombination-associated protein RdgC [Methyloprofundus sp.]HIG65129.1 recombination-associated protein RdgC [Methyloprofundus sp.]HIL78401.1 recombination-associated protein RdgC [Methylococcales bacterium]